MKAKDCFQGGRWMAEQRGAFIDSEDKLLVFAGKLREEEVANKRYVSPGCRIVRAATRLRRMDK